MVANAECVIGILFLYKLLEIFDLQFSESNSLSYILQLSLSQ
jgi:hypothetical protein